jgi:hypothetical protein
MSSAGSSRKFSVLVDLLEISDPVIKMLDNVLYKTSVKSNLSSLTATICQRKTLLYP